MINGLSYIFDISDCIYNVTNTKILIGVGCMGNLYFDLGCFLRFQIAYIDIIWPKKVYKLTAIPELCRDFRPEYTL